MVAQETYPVNGVVDKRPIYHAFTNALIYASPNERVDSATLLIREDKIVAVGQGVSIPENAVVHDCSDLVIYASFIDPYAGINVTQKKGKTQKAKAAQPKTEGKKGGNWNPAIHPEAVYEQPFPIDAKKAQDWLAGGIGLVNVHHRDGIMRGTSQVFALGIPEANKALVEVDHVQHFSFSKGSSQADYPSSFIGAIALIRQTLYDAQWYANQPPPRVEVNPSLEALQGLNDHPSIFELNHSLSVRNVLELNSEFGTQFIMKGTGREYLVLDELTPESRLIVPLNFPKALDVSDPFDARMVSLQKMKHWESASFNPHFLQESGVTFCLTRDTIAKHQTFLQNLQKSIHSGWGHDSALAALTTIPAEFLDLSDQVGTLSTGKQANFIIVNKTMDEPGFRVEEHWTKGRKVFEAKPVFADLIGTYNLVIEKVDYAVRVDKVTPEKITAKVTTDKGKSKLKIEIKQQGELLSMVLMSGDSVPQVLYRLSGKISLKGSLWDGKGQDTNGKWITWAAVKSRKSETPKTQETSRDSVSIPQIAHPNKAYGWDSLSSERTFVITNATVWTAADTGILKTADIYVVDGKIQAVGADMMFPTEVKRINAKGKHVTPGLVDEHAHIGIRGGVNEWAQSSSAEVRIADALDPWNENIYRQLGGGVTAAQLLHGSANPIGGQSAIVKFKWGRGASEMLIADAPGFIKFALGENVKRSNRKEHKNRFPLTRMGVEQTFADAFTRAGEYQLSGPMPEPTLSQRLLRNEPQPVAAQSQRKDLELETIREILDGQRHITCHSYVQSEILMLMALADSFGFKVNTFTHILEGYKVAEELHEHEANASTFSDWWAYKFEVNDAIPYNAALLVKSGINTAINSDDAEMGRRLNQEAAKAMKYGGLTPEQAIQLVTINPAKMLHLDHRIGTIEVGKDADLVIWNGEPLSVYSHVEKTFIEGELYFDRGASARAHVQIEKERARLVNQMIQSKDKNKQKPKAEKQRHYHCDTVLDDYLNE